MYSLANNANRRPSPNELAASPAAGGDAAAAAVDDDGDAAAAADDDAYDAAAAAGGAASASSSAAALLPLQVDAGEAFKFTEAYNKFYTTFNPLAPASQKLADLRDLQFGNQHSVTIRWELLAAGQRRAFLRALLRGQDFLRDPAVVQFLVRRRGEFDRAASDGGAVGGRPGGAAAAGGGGAADDDAGRLLADAVVRPFVDSWSAYRDAQMLPEVYGRALLREVHATQPADVAAEVAVASVPFVPGRYGAVDHSIEEAVKLSRER